VLGAADFPSQERSGFGYPWSVSHEHPTADDFSFKEDRHTAAYTCKHVWTDGKPILLVSHGGEGDWQFLCGEDHDETAAAKDGLVVCLEHVAHRDPSVNELATMCTGHVASRAHVGAPWKIADETLDDIRCVIDEHGWWVGLVHSEGEAPAFAYTIGLYEKFGHPEIIVFGLVPKSMHRILNHCGGMVRDGKRFEVGTSVSDVLDSYDVRFQLVTAKESYMRYLGYGCRHYGDRMFPVLQLLWPDKQHKFPGDAGAAEFLGSLQPLLV
jgi:hypothetical protein